MQGVKSCAFLLATALLLSGCAGPQVGQYRTRSYLGWHTVQEKLPSSTEQAPVVERIRTLGLRLGSGLGIGYFDDSRVELPRECRLVIFVKDLQQLAQFFDAYPQLQQGDNPCIKPNAL